MKTGTGPKRWRWILAGVALLTAVAFSAWVGYRIRDGNLVERLTAALERRVLFARSALGEDTRVAEWRPLVTNLHTLEYAALKLGPYTGHGGGITEADGQIVIATPRGRLLRVNAELQVAAIDARIPMEYDRLRKSRIIDDPLFPVASFRTYDVLTVPRGGKLYDLYASHARFKSDDCFQFVVSRLRMTTQPQLRAVGSGWEDVFVARPDCIRPKNRGWKFWGLAAGGRLAMRDTQTLLVSIGDHQFDGINDSWVASQDPGTDLGKVVVIDLESGRSSILATGVRNPQGLLVASDGRIWETEHGPHGGDEINLIAPGNNYGWPLATYGVNYGYPRRLFSEKSEPGRHEGFVPPVLAFVPSVGISNIAQPDLGEFPYWRDDLLVASLIANTLFRVRTEGDRIVYAEPIRFEGKRLRDITALPDGRFAMLTDNNELVLLRNAELHPDEPSVLTFTGFATLPAPPAEDIEPRDGAPEERGRSLFQVGCGSCHNLTAEIATGPPLAGIVGRPIGSYPGFSYSEALQNADGTWDEDLLVAFITDPQRHFKGTTMPAATLEWDDAPNIVAFLKTIKAQ